MATTTTSSIVALFSTEHQAAEAIQALQAAGFQAHEIGAARSAGYAGNATQTGVNNQTTSASLTGTTGMGARTEGMWDKVKNFFEGNEAQGSVGGVEQYADERGTGRANNYDSHEITSGGYPYDQGDVSGLLTNLSVSRDRSQYFEHRLSTQPGSVLVTLSAGDRQAEAEGILAQHGGDLGGASTSYDYSAAEAQAPAAATATGQQRIQLLGEVLRVHKDRISRGEVRIRKEVITEQQTIQVPVSREELVIERIAASGQTGVQGQIGENSEIRIPLTEETASVDRQTVVREEIAVGKRAVESVQEVGGAVRHEELEVEDGTTPSGTAVSGATTRTPTTNR